SAPATSSGWCVRPAATPKATAAATPPKTGRAAARGIRAACERPAAIGSDPRQAFLVQRLGPRDEPAQRELGLAALGGGGPEPRPQRRIVEQRADRAPEALDVA